MAFEKESLDTLHLLDVMMDPATNKKVADILPPIIAAFLLCFAIFIALLWACGGCAKAKAKKDE